MQTSRQAMEGAKLQSRRNREAEALRKKLQVQFQLPPVWSLNVGWCVVLIYSMVSKLVSKLIYFMVSKSHPPVKQALKCPTLWWTKTVQTNNHGFAWKRAFLVTKFRPPPHFHACQLCLCSWAMMSTCLCKSGSLKSWWNELQPPGMLLYATKPTRWHCLNKH